MLLYVQHLCNPKYPNFNKAFDAIADMVEKDTESNSILQTPDYNAKRPGLFADFSLAKPSDGTPGKPTSTYRSSPRVHNRVMLERVIPIYTFCLCSVSYFPSIAGQTSVGE